MLDSQKLAKIEEFVGSTLSKQTQERFHMFVQLFSFYNAHTNLVSKNDEKKLFEKHICDSLALSQFLNKYSISADAMLLDVGTGGGFPSIPLSIVYPEMNVYPLDSIAKKIGFIELVQKELRLSCLHPICKRVEDFADNNKTKFDVVTSRAVASLNTLLEYTIPFLKIGGYFVAFKSKGSDSELVQAENAMNVLGCSLVDRIKYVLPIDEEFVRELLVFKKTKDTPVLYPRKSGMAKKNPL